MPRKTKMNDITSPALISQINPQNKVLISDYLSYLKSTQRSESTIKSYKNDLEIAMVWNLLNNGNKFFIDWTKRNIVAYQNWLINENENSPSRVRRLKATLSSLSNYISNICDDEYPNFKNIINKVENPINQPVREKTVLSIDQIDFLLDCLVSKKQYKKACMLALAICSGRRKAELVRFKVSDFKDENLICDKALYKTSDKIKTKGRGNGKYIYCYTLAKKFKPFLDLWLAYREENNIDSEWLFPLEEDPSEQMKPTTLNSWAITFGNILGTDFYWHCIRHAHVTYLVRAGIPDAVIQQLLGWETAQMCRVYTDIDADEQFEKYFGKDGIKSVEKKSLSDI